MTTTVTLETIKAIRNADPITLRAAHVLGWLEGRGGFATNSELEEAMSPRTTHADGVVGVHTAMTGTGVLFRRGFIRRDGEVICLTHEGREFFMNPEN